MAIELKKAGLCSFTIFERACEIGGTWRDNTYPGAACDVPSHVYSFSFESNPDWSRMYATSGEIQSYLQRCVEKYGLRRHLRTNTEIVEARFDADSGIWRLATHTGETVTARVVVAAMGGLVDPAYPSIDGIVSFSGEMFHTARWDHECDLTGRNVAVIGTGASAVQVIPEIAKIAARLLVFQRTPAWVLPRRDRVIGARAKRVYRRFPWVQRAVRSALFWLSEARGPMVVLDSPLSRIAERASLRHLRASVSDSKLRQKLRPRFRFGCKRVLISDDYWSTLERENVELVDSGIARIRSRSIESADGEEHLVDVIVLATGFAVGFSRAPFPVTGRGGRGLDAVWSRGATAYKGMTVAGFPNWFILMGPNTGPGHTSVLVYTESQIAYVLQAIRKLIAEDIGWMDVRQRVQDRYNAGLDRRMKYTSWSSGCRSWYLSEDGANHSLYPGFASEYCARTRRLDASDYEFGPAVRRQEETD